MALRAGKDIVSAAALAGGAFTRLDTTPIRQSLGAGGHFSAHVRVDNGSGQAPTDNPVGTWKLYCSCGGQRFEEFTGQDIVDELAKIALTGNVLVSGWVVFNGLPGTEAKLVLTQLSGGTGTSVITVGVAADS
jgi:hypothetical protein